MPIIQVTTEELVEAIKRLPPEELDRVANEIISLRDQLQASNLADGNINGKPSAEAELLDKIVASIPKETHTRYRTLITKRDTRTLSQAEYEELLKLTDVIEKFDAERAGYLVQLAVLRNVSLSRLMDDLGIQPTDA